MVPSRINSITGSFTNLTILFISIAARSVPPVAQFLTMAIPIALPTKRPPIIPAIKRLSVTWISGISFKNKGDINVM